MAVTDKDPTEAIMLVEQTVNTFNQIVVGQEGQMIPVPGYPDQPTLAERVKQNLKPSTNAAASYAAQASASAKAADDAAKLASQISGLDTVADAIGLAALPLPDVWIPFTDLLRMFAGYGREVKVGDDVIARYVNFERTTNAWYFDKMGNLRLAAVNEPRFESEGLLIEGQSTNIFRWDATRIPADGGSQTSVTSSKYTGITAKKITGGSNALVFGASREQIKNSTIYTATAIIDLDNSNIPLKRLRLQFAWSANWLNRQVNVDIDGNILSTTADTTGTAKRIGNLLIVTATTISSVDASTSGGGSLDLFYLNEQGGAQVPQADWSLCVVGFQLEEAPGASSFILTSNAAATRAADFPYIPRSGNDNYFGQLTVAAEIHLNAAMVSGNVTDARRGILSGYPSSAAYEVLMVDPLNSRLAWAYGNASFSGGANQPALNDQKMHTIVAQTDIVQNRCYTDGVEGSVKQPATPVFGADNGTSKDRWHIGYGAGGSMVRHLWGHIRNLRIWHRALTDSQIKAIR
ncbi:phage head spike fiber domain-containing protein [Aeromonas finlandensis]|uniref:phage head spike fiber domain-containing protein n=1 Tax=Aeromonas finlandensis TaxID=1543375 RepID=UPI00051B5DC0|nr:LamG-like jellyroll fold domain-containing protein [Aeromonas finlandensis]